MTSYRPKMRARPAQEKALAKMEGHDAFALLMAMRTGKTKVALDHFGRLELAGERKDLLVEAPGGVYRTWEQAIQEHCSEDLLSRGLLHTWESGAGAPARRRLARFLETVDPQRPRILLVNAEAVSRPGEARAITKTFLGQRSRLSMMAIDESTLNKNPSAKRTKFNNRELAPLAATRLIMSGLATPRSPLDLFSQFEFLDWEILGYKSYFAFRAHFAKMKPMNFGGRWVQVVDGYQNVEELYDLIEPHSFRVEFRPKIPSTYSFWDVEMTAEQRRIYSEIRDEACSRLDAMSHVSATVVITQMLRLHQVLMGHVADEQGQVHLIPESRTSDLLEILEDYGGKAIIWVTYDIDVHKVAAAITKEYGEGSVARFWGGNLKTRESEKQSFIRSPSCRFMVSTPGAGGKGQTWDVADLVVYYGYTNNLEHQDQSEQRAMGVSKERQVDFIHMRCPDTVEMPFLEAIRVKMDMASTINGDDYKRWLI